MGAPSPNASRRRLGGRFLGREGFLRLARGVLGEFRGARGDFARLSRHTIGRANFEAGDCARRAPLSAPT